MLIKLIKHELKSSYRSYIGVYAGIVVFSILLAIQSSGDTSFEGFAMTFSLTIFLLMALYILMFVNIVKSLGNRIFGKPGYLLFTVPAKTSEIVLSRVITNFIWIVISTITAAIPIVIFTTVIIGQIDPNITTSFDVIIDLIRDEIIGEYGSIGSAVTMYLSLFALQFLSLIAVVLLANTFANTLYKGDKKLLIAIVIFFAINIFTNMILSSSLFVTTETVYDPYLVIMQLICIVQYINNS